MNNITPRESEQTSTGSSVTREYGKPTNEAEQMTAETTAHKADMAADAVSHDQRSWHAIDWQKAHQTVRRLQARIVKAQQEGKYGKVKALQRLLTHSFSGKAIAVKRVTENQGKRTPGVDRVTWTTPEQKAAAIDALRQRGYQPRPLRRIYIPKNSGGRRPLGIPTMQDRSMQALYLLALDPIAETTGDPNSYGFRQLRSAADAIEQCFGMLAKASSAKWVLEGDIKSCFDRISHDWILAHVPMDKAILRKWLKAGFLEDGILHPTDEGTPQGGICSPVIANMVLDGLEARLRETFPTNAKRGGKFYSAKVNLIRYADDFVVTGRSKEQLDTEVKPLVEQFMKERGLELSQEKTVITHIEEGFDFLGQNVRTYNGKMLIKPSKKSILSLLRRLRSIIKNSRGVSAGILIDRLNPLIKGWAMYHRHVVSADIFNSIDNALWHSLWRWAKRRHPRKSAAWVKAKYFHRNGLRNGDFTGVRVDRKDNTETIRLMRMSTVHIKRHTKVKNRVNPYDPTWEEYIETRQGLQMIATLKGRRTLLYLWKQQGGTCPLCGQAITKITGWHNHHKIWRSRGGSNAAPNRVLLHPNCHRQVHHPDGLTVAPRLGNKALVMA